MKGFWYPWEPTLYRQDTMHLTAEQDGVYRRLIDHYMETAQPLPDNIQALARIAGVGCDSDAIRIAIAFFTHTEGIGYTHKKCDSTLLEMHDRHVKRHGAAKAGATARWKNIKKIQRASCDSDANSNAIAMRFDATHTHTHTEEKKALSVALEPDFELFWVGWLPFEMPKGSKQDAMKAYLKARKATDHETLIRTRDQYLANCRNLRCKSKHASSWLNGRGWEQDDALGEIKEGGPRGGYGNRGQANEPTAVEIALADRTYR